MPPKFPIDDHADVAGALGRAIAIWSTIELTLSMHFQAFAKLDGEASLVIWNSLPTFRVKRETLLRLAKIRLSDEQFQNYRRVLERVRRQAIKRNALAHSVLGSSNERTQLTQIKIGFDADYELTHGARIEMTAANLNQIGDTFANLHQDVLNVVMGTYLRSEQNTTNPNLG